VDQKLKLRISKFLKSFADVVLVESPEDPNPPKYAYLLNYWRFRTGNFKWQIPKPHWTRQMHQKLVDGKFNGACVRTILLMQKFRPMEFPLHKDLIDAVIREVFNLHVDDLRDGMIAKETWIKELLVRPEERIKETLINLGLVPVYYRQSAEKKTIYSDAYDLVHGISINKDRQDYYHPEMLNYMLSWTSIINTGLVSSGIYNKESFTKIGIIYDYIQSKKYKLYDIYTGTFPLTPDGIRELTEMLDSAMRVFNNLVDSDEH
jgi:hypothetical protein